MPVQIAILGGSDPNHRNMQADKRSRPYPSIQSKETGYVRPDSSDETEEFYSLDIGE
jgi:hypothetical protein